MDWERITTTDDGIELWVKTVLRVNVWQTRHPECQWKSGGHETKAAAIVVGAVHECGSSYSLDAMLGDPVSKIPSIRPAGSSVVSKASK